MQYVMTSKFDCCEIQNEVNAQSTTKNVPKMQIGNLDYAQLSMRALRISPITADESCPWSSINKMRIYHENR
jgi:hypothetical protein